MAGEISGFGAASGIPLNMDVVGAPSDRKAAIELLDEFAIPEQYRELTLDLLMALKNRRTKGAATIADQLARRLYAQADLHL